MNYVTRPRLVVLDGLRGVAAVVVLIAHTLAKLRWPAFPSMLAVDLFFMISGFVIPFAYEEQLKSGLSAARFAMIRFVRLYPLYILGVALGLIPHIIWAWYEGVWRLRIPLVEWLLPWGLLLLPKPVPEPEHSFMLNPAAWSLFLECVVNALYVLVLPYLTLRLLGVIVGASAVTLAIAASLFGGLNFGTGGWELTWGLARAGCPFAIGVLVYRLWQMRRLPDWQFSTLLAPVLFLLTLALPTGLTSWAVVVFFFLVWVAVQSSPGRRATQVFTWLGDLSYTLYMVHYAVLLTVQTAGLKEGLPNTALLLGAFPMTFVVAAVAGRWYNRRARTILVGRFGLRRERVEATRAL
ncbi:Peptidoglycan/LPS O-acetylase OafA/YrhL, contains acyltransferase and SGNH-hydrolase domains [Sphingomonas guangdongensis]|uniref:Peptidoglycan/LPS O-acetylase OafA/YrhL, contains acyltransferase and SGNH-hydrolase domains n=1 Tax=Sphingomonas guangdongensis TaxID=1141890 RepID=A0A285QI33_9SPHN|nr:acyltransferase [Sphingomonas guangdongensis]SOB81144.1 Peptidoglycan/LPS O-acetylase OafA/YrhL, contains acyltransferase and SGNH-hydrolase domains [Sphingomonas guangdongensis]